MRGGSSRNIADIPLASYVSVLTLLFRVLRCVIPLRRLFQFLTLRLVPHLFLLPISRRLFIRSPSFFFFSLFLVVFLFQESRGESKEYLSLLFFSFLSLVLLSGKLLVDRRNWGVEFLESLVTRNDLLRII